MGNHPSTFKYFFKNQFNSDSVVVITGASSGMGRELAYQYAKRGCKVVIAARREERLNQIRDECYQQFGNANVVPVPCDLDVESEAKRLIDTAVEHFFQIDILVLCAGVSAHQMFEDFSDLTLFKKVVETNLYSCVYPTRYALHHLKKTNRRCKTKGHIVVFSSFSGEFGLAKRSNYSASKFAVQGFFESLRMELED